MANLANYTSLKISRLASNFHGVRANQLLPVEREIKEVCGNFGGSQASNGLSLSVGLPETSALCLGTLINLRWRDATDNVILKNQVITPGNDSLASKACSV